MIEVDASDPAFANPTKAIGPLYDTEEATQLERPKVRAACEFVERTGNRAVIGSIGETEALVHGEAGTVVALEPTSRYPLMDERPPRSPSLLDAILPIVVLIVPIALTAS